MRYFVFLSILLLAAAITPAAEEDGYDITAAVIKNAENFSDTSPAAQPVVQAALPDNMSFKTWLSGFLLLCLGAGLAGSALIWLARRLMLVVRRDEVMVLIQNPCRHALAQDCPFNNPRCWNEEGQTRWVEQQSLPDLESLLTRHRECSRSR